MNNVCDWNCKKNVNIQKALVFYKLMCYNCFRAVGKEISAVTTLGSAFGLTSFEEAPDRLLGSG